MVQKLNATAKLVEGYRIDVDDGRAHTFCLDLQPPSGKDMGPSPLELAVMSFAGCYAVIFALTAKKMRFPVKDMEVKLEAIKSEEAGTITEASIDVSVRIDGPKDRVQRIHELTLKNCPVGELFDRAGVKTKYNIRTE
jgi:uncharacterized OsmC-like protein